MGVRSSKIAPSEDPLHLEFIVDDDGRMIFRLTNVSGHTAIIPEHCSIKNSIIRTRLKDVETGRYIEAYANDELVNWNRVLKYVKILSGAIHEIDIGYVDDLWGLSKEDRVYEIKVIIDVVVSRWKSRIIKKTFNLCI
jgi:hypothetical protein